MRLVRNILGGLQTLLRKNRKDAELDAEVRAYLEMAVWEKLKQGMSRKEALRSVRLEQGSAETAKEEVAAASWESFVETVWQDLRFAARTLRRSPGFTAAAVLTIGLGIGINVGIFSVFNGAALRLLPIPRAEQTVSLNQIFHSRTVRNTREETSMFSYPEYIEYRDHNQVFSGLVAYEPFIEATLRGSGMRQILGQATSCNYFEVLNERPALGRGFVDSDCSLPKGNAVAIISDALWRGAFAADPMLVGKSITLNRTAYTVIGIAPSGFNGTDIIPHEFWVPISTQAALEGGIDRLADNRLSWLALLGRIKSGVTLDQVRADLSVIAGGIDALDPGRRTSLVIHKATFFGSPEQREILFPIASVILASFGLVLLIACANVANLVLARASARQREIAVRRSIGASHWRLVRQLLTESLLLVSIGGALGSALSFLSFAGMTRLAISHLPGAFSKLAVDATPDVFVLTYALGLTLLTGIAFGLMPALQTSRVDLNTALKDESAYAGSGKKSGLLRSALVAAQIAVSMILLLAAGLLLRGLYYAQTVDPGFEMKGVASVFLNLQREGYDNSRGEALMRRLRERIASIPGVTEVAQAECAPLSHDFSADRFTIPGRPEKVAIEYNHVSPEYFSVVGIPIVRGRGFTSADAREGATGIIVTESTARLLWGGEDPLGKTLREDTGREYSVIGVTKDAQISHLGDLPTAYLFFPAGIQNNLRVYVLARFAGPFSVAAKAIRDTVRSLDPDIPAEVTRLEDYLEVWRTPSRIVALLSGALGTLALLLASLGVYAMVSYSVSRCLREIAIRMALGARGGEIGRLVLTRGMRPVLIGGALGIGGCAAVSSVVSSMLFGLSAHDPVTFCTVPLSLLAVALLASYVPARRAMRVDPMVALRYE